VQQRVPEWPLDERIVIGLVAAQFPELAGQRVARLGGGLDHELFSVGEQWILRFPRRADRVPWLRREIDILATVSETLGRMVPRFELIGEPSQAFGYPFVGYRRLPGVGADQRPVGANLASEIGALLTAVHRVDPRRIPPTPAGWEDEPWLELRTALAAAAPAVDRVLGPSLRGLAAPYLAGLVPVPAQQGQRRFIHNDICPEHVLVDQDLGSLTGLIDFTDAMVGDPVLDFVGLIGIGGYDFIARVVACYGLPVDEAFWSKLTWLARTLTLTWLADSVCEDQAAVPMHLAWVGRAFERAERD
jgi:aminoglycoside phosphotransferase (APT) family kinase protein